MSWEQIRSKFSTLMARPKYKWGVVTLATVLVTLPLLPKNGGRSYQGPQSTASYLGSTAQPAARQPSAPQPQVQPLTPIDYIITDNSRRDDGVSGWTSPKLQEVDY